MYTNRMAVARRYGKSHRASRLFGEARFLIFRMTRNAFTVFLQNWQRPIISLAEVLEKFNIALGKAKFIVGQNLGFDINIMGCEFYRMG
jgi:hypothetical protein